MVNKKKLFDITFQGSKTSLNYIKKPIFKLDEKGVLAYKIPYTNKFDYYPIHMARFALGALEKYTEKNDQKYKDLFLNQVDWLHKNLVKKGKFAVWEHNYKVPFYDFKKLPWIHGLGQALGMIALLKAYQLLDDKKYLDDSLKIYECFKVDIKNGGDRYIDEKGNLWLEEYAISPPPHVLNGFITILFSIHELQRFTNKEETLEIWDKGIKTIKENIQRYDAGYWSYYNLLHKYPSTQGYHQMHVRQLRVLHKLTDEKIFKEYSEKWDKQANKILNKKLANINRGFMHVKRYGPIGVIKRYSERKKWNKK